MAGLMSRASLVVKSKLSKLLDRAEDPGETLDYSYEKQLELLQNVKRGIADVVTAKKRLELQAGRSSSRSVVEARRPGAQGARGGPRGSRPAGARAQGRSSSSSSRGSTSRSQQPRGAAGEARREREARSRPRSRPSAAQKEVIKAQYSAAEAQVRIGEAATGIGEEMADTGLAIQRAKDKTEQMQARASAVDELIDVRRRSRTSPPTRRSSTASCAQIASQAQVDDELAKLKAELGSRRGRRRS